MFQLMTIIYTCRTQLFTFLKNHNFTLYIGFNATTNQFYSVKIFHDNIMQYGYVLK
jgi:hypothetical protein